MPTMRRGRTVAEFLRIPEGRLSELIDGSVHRRPPTDLQHQEIVGKLMCVLDRFIERRNLGKLGLGPVDVILPTHDVLEPDFIFLKQKHRALWQQQVRGVPDIVIEVLSSPSLERDRVVKRRIYARAGVPEYWIVDGVWRNVEVLTLAAGRYESTRLFGERSALRSKQFRYLPLSLRGVFPE